MDCTRTIGWLIGLAMASLVPLGAAAAGLAGPVSDEPQAPVSQCMAVAEAPLPFRRASTGKTLSADEVRITFVGHSTFRIESAGGVIIATDYNGYAGGVTPRVVTMNHAHSSHYTDFVDPAIDYVLRGWDIGHGPAKYNMQVDDVIIRNVTTDIRSGFQTMEHDGNSIFIFEVAGLCIGHLGHLHHRLTDEQYAMIGRLDIVMVPVDGTYTMGHQGMLEVVQRLRASIVLPMHYFGALSFNAFLSEMGKELPVELNQGPTVVMSLAALPRTPKILVLPGY